MISVARAHEITEDRYSFVYRYCLYKLGSEADAADVTGEVFILFYSKLAWLDDDGIAAWLYRTADNKMHELFRKKKERQRLLPIDAVDCAEDAQVQRLIDSCEEESFDEETLMDIKETVLAALSPEERRLYALVYMQKRDRGAVANDLGVSRNAAGVRIFRLKSKIERLVRQRMAQRREETGGSL